jgi:signal transduction histidine kinase
VSRTRVVLPFALCAAALFGVMARLTSEVRRLEAAERRGREAAAVEEGVRLALWRMESLLTPLVARENARPYRLYTANARDGPGAAPHVRLAFEWDAEGRLATPRPEGSSPLAALRGMIDGAALSARLDGSLLTVERSVPPPAPRAPAAAADPGQQQALLNVQEFQAREAQLAASNALAPVAPRPTEVRVGLLQPLWLGDELVLARRVAIDRGRLVQGVWLDWPALRAWLLGSVRDLFPEAALVPVRDGEPDPGRRLAALPVRLEPGRPAAAMPPGGSPVGLTLLVAWASAVVAVLAVGGLLWGLATLDERRSAFVSAVTHELRTPLTTFRMYADMLAEGMVADDEQRRAYLATLQREAERQSHLVENVLAYSRLERGRYARTRAVAVEVGPLLASVLPPLQAQAARAARPLEVSLDDACAAARVQVDPAAVERVLFNLVDNACKHARAAADPTLQLQGRVEGGAVRLTLADRGPGVAAGLRRRLFRPFHKPAEDAAGAAPGVGLGLALSRRLARAQGGDLRLTQTGPEGSRFTLTLPVARQRQ